MKQLWTFCARYYLICLGILIHILFYLSAWQFKWFNFFFSGSSLHLCCRGLDFYQVPNGAYAYLHGGHLNGWLPPGHWPYALGFYSNRNVYHPFFTLTLGTFLTFFTPYTSFYIWMLFKFCLTIPLLFYFYLSFKESKHIQLAMFLTLINSTQYLEIEISQFHFVLNFFLFLLLIHAAKSKQSFCDGLFYACTLLVKPIGLLWIPVLFLKKQYQTLFLGLTIFSATTIFSLFTGAGQYYYNYLLQHIMRSTTSGPIQIITLGALLHALAIPNVFINVLKGILLIGFLLLTSFKRINLVTGVYLMIVYYLLFYDQVFEYHYTTLIPVLGVALVYCPEFQTRLARACIVLVSLPNIFFLLRLLHIGVVMNPFLGPDPTILGWQLIVLCRLLPLICLTTLVLKPVTLPILEDIKTLATVFKPVGTR